MDRPPGVADDFWPAHPPPATPLQPRNRRPWPQIESVLSWNARIQPESRRDGNYFAGLLGLIPVSPFPCPLQSGQRNGDMGMHGRGLTTDDTDFTDGERSIFFIRAIRGQIFIRRICRGF